MTADKKTGKTHRRKKIVEVVPLAEVLRRAKDVDGGIPSQRVVRERGKTEPYFADARKVGQK